MSVMNVPKAENGYMEDEGFSWWAWRLSPVEFRVQCKCECGHIEPVYWGNFVGLDSGAILDFDCKQEKCRWSGQIQLIGWETPA